MLDAVLKNILLNMGSILIREKGAVPSGTSCELPCACTCYSKTSKTNKNILLKIN